MPNSRPASPDRIDGTTSAFLAALGLLPGSRRSMWHAARRAFLDRIDPEARMPVGKAWGRDNDDNLVEFDLAEERAASLLIIAKDRADHQMYTTRLERIKAYLVAPYIDEAMDAALCRAEERAAWQQQFDNLPGWVQRRCGSAEAVNPYEAGRKNAGPLTAEHLASIARARQFTRDEDAAKAAFGRALTIEAGLDPQRRRIIGQLMRAEAAAGRPAARP